MSHLLTTLVLLVLLAACGKEKTATPTPANNPTPAPNAAQTPPTPTGKSLSSQEKILCSKTWRISQKADSWTSRNYADNHGRASARFDVNRFLELSFTANSLSAYMSCDTELDNEGGARNTISKSSVKIKVEPDQFEILNSDVPGTYHYLDLRSHETMKYYCSPDLYAGVYSYSIEWDANQRTWQLRITRKGNEGKSGVFWDLWRLHSERE